MWSRGAGVARGVPHSVSGLNIGSAPLRVPAGAAPAAPPADGKPVNEDKVCRSPVSGIVVRVAAQVGQSLQTGDILLVLEAMKMETNITAPAAGQDCRHQREPGRRRAGRAGGGGVRIMSAQLEQVPGFLFFDHVAISVKPGELEAHVKAYQAMGFKEMHREDVLGGDQVREVLLQVGDGPNLVQLLEPLTPESPVAKQIEKNGGRGGMAHVALRVADIQKAFDYLKETRLQDHRQGAAQGLARHHGLLPASEDHRGGRVRLPAGSRAGGRSCLKPMRVPRS